MVLQQKPYTIVLFYATPYSVSLNINDPFPLYPYSSNVHLMYQTSTHTQIEKQLYI
jgi:hypothetical protein